MSLEMQSVSWESGLAASTGVAESAGVLLFAWGLAAGGLVGQNQKGNVILRAHSQIGGRSQSKDKAENWHGNCLGARLIAGTSAEGIQGDLLFFR